MADHAQRAHATWSASATDRSWNCPGSLALINSLNVPDKESEAAAWGTACHQISEKCLRSGQDAVEYIDRIEKTKEFAFVVDEEMADCAQVYIDYVRSQAGTPDLLENGVNEAWVEQRFSLEKLNPPFDAGGTADAVIYFPAEKLLEVIDLKGGRGVVVEAKGNPQLRTYALGAMLAFPGLDVTHVKSTIVQPRAGHKDGRIRSETFHVVDLMEWTADLLAAMHKANEAGNARDEMDDMQWSVLYLNAGSHCKFCKAGGVCPAQEQKALDAAGVWFDDQDKPRISNQPDTAAPEKAAQTLDLLDMVEDWIKAYRAYWHTQAEMGVEIYDPTTEARYILVPKEGREKWKDEAQVTVEKTCFDAGLPEDKYLNAPKLRTPKQVRDAFKKAKLDLPSELDGLSEKPSAGTNLVRADKTSRDAVKPKAQQFFNVID